MIYLDNNASTKLDPEVREAVERALELSGNPSSIHADGRRARRAIEEARDEVAALIGARPEDVVFTSGGTEANALAILSAAARGGRIVRTAVEHPSVAAAFDRAAAAGGVEAVAVAPRPDGTFDLDHLVKAIGPSTALV